MSSSPISRIPAPTRPSWPSRWSVSADRTILVTAACFIEWASIEEMGYERRLGTGADFRVDGGTTAQ